MKFHIDSLAKRKFLDSITLYGNIIKHGTCLLGLAWLAWLG